MNYEHHELWLDDNGFHVFHVIVSCAKPRNYHRRMFSFVCVTVGFDSCKILACCNYYMACSFLMHGRIGEGIRD
jgi:hypothetical protein